MMHWYIATAHDLRNWATDCFPGLPPEEIDNIVAHVRSLPDRPEWGTDWTAWLNSLSMDSILEAIWEPPVNP